MLAFAWEQEFEFFLMLAIRATEEREPLAHLPVGSQNIDGWLLPDKRRMVVLGCYCLQLLAS